MKILINALSTRGGGGQTYLTHLLGKFPKDGKNEVFIVCPDTLVLPIDRTNIHRLVGANFLINNPNVLLPISHPLVITENYFTSIQN